MLQNQIGAKTSVGTIWMNTGNNTGVSFSFTTSYKELTSLGTNFTLMSTSPDFAMTTDGRLKYTGLNTKTFLATATVAFITGNNKSIAIYKNGSLITGAECYAGLNIFLLPNVTVSLSTNDYLSIFTKISSSGSSFISQIILTAESVM